MPGSDLNGPLFDEDDEDECRVCRGPEEEGCVLIIAFFDRLFVVQGIP
jgi:hypothetical protein